MRRPLSPTLLVVVIAAPALLAGAAGCRRKAEARDTHVSERPFELTLPGPWKRQAEPGGQRWVYRSERYHAQLTVSVMLAAGPRAPDEAASALESLVEQHRASEVAAGGSTLQLSDTVRTTAGDVRAARVDGVEPAVPRWSSSLVLVSPTGAALFHFEADGPRDAAALRRAWDAFDSIRVR